MLHTSAITPNIHYIGVDDYKTELFESIWPIPTGVSYNSYIVKGDKTALIDTVEAEFYPLFLDHVKALGWADPSYLVINHMEPDHSGALPQITKEFPDLKIIGNAITARMIQGFYPDIDPGRIKVVKDGETLDLGGGTTLQFHTIPMVHWPETMATYVPGQGVLFSGDAFGTFGALGGGVLDSDFGDTSMYIAEMYRYYACIVAKYAEPVRKALAKLGPLPLALLCPTHGPVWKEQLEQVLDIYRKLCHDETEAGVVIVSASMYGHTSEVTRLLQQCLQDRGYKVKYHDACRTDISYILADIWQYAALVVASPTYNGSVMPQIQALLSALEMRALSNRAAAAIGNYAWAPMAAKTINQTFTNLGLEIVVPPIELKMKPVNEQLAPVTGLAEKLDEFFTSFADIQGRK